MGSTIGGVTVLPRIDSTNRYVLRRFAEIPDRHAVVARTQTAGRGRLSRDWSSPDGNLYLTLALHLSSSTQPPGFFSLTQYMAVTLTRVLAQYGVVAELKWPNDVRVGGRKIAGILAEGATVGDRLVGLALGVGVNITMSVEDLERIDQPATALSAECESEPGVDDFRDLLLDRFLQGYDRFMARGFLEIRAEYMEKSPFLGRRISIVSLDSQIAGLARDITMDGALLVELDDGANVKITLGDVQC